jgi:dTDP-4-dehydrorhamnose reductase
MHRRFSIKHQQNVCITGAGGFIGGKLFSKLKLINPIGISHGMESNQMGNVINIDLRDESLVNSFFQEYSVKVIYHFAGLNYPHINEKKPLLAEESHINITNNILNNIEGSTHIIFLSTDKIFDGIDTFPNEKTKPNPQWLYSGLKLQCEKIIQQRIKKYHILRLPIVHSFGDDDALSKMAGPSPFIDKAIKNLKAGQEVKVFDNVYRCFLRLDELVTLLVMLMNDTHYGVYHIGSKMMSYYDRLKMLCDELQIKWKGKLIPISGKVSPMSQNLDTSALRNTFSYILT